MQGTTDGPVWRQSLCSALAAYALVGGALSLLGWVLDIPRLTDWLGSGISIQPDSAVLLAASGTGLILAQYGHRHLAMILGACVATMGVLLLLQHVLGADFSFVAELAYRREWGRAGTVAPGRVGPPGSVSNTLTGVALLLLAYTQGRPERAALRRFVPVLGAAVALIVLFSLIGYLLGAQKFYAVPWLTAIAFQTSTMLLALACALVLNVPEQQPLRIVLSSTAAGILARRLLPVLILVPPFLAWLSVEGEVRGAFDEGTGRSLLVAGIVLLGVGSIWWVLRILEREERSQRDSARLVVETIDSLQAGFIRLDAAWRFVYANKPAERLMGSDTMIGRRWHEALSPAFGPHVAEAIAQAVRRHTPGEIEGYCEQDQQWYSIRVHPMSDGGCTLLFHDITDRRHAEQTLQQKALRMQHLCAAAGVLLNADAPDEMLQRLFEKIAPLLDLDVYFNYVVHGHRLSLASYGGLTAEAAAGVQSLDFGQAVCGNVALQRHAITVQNIGECDDPMAGVVRSLGLQAYTCHPLVAGDRLIGTLSFGSRTKRAFGADDLEFLQTICHYAAAAAGRIYLIQKLRSTDRHKDEFLATLAHELRNPLAPVRNAVQILRSTHAAEQELQWARDVVDRQLRHMTRLIDDLLDVSRISKGKLKLKREHVELAKIVHQALEVSAPVIEQHGHQLTVELPAQPVCVEADPARVVQIVYNLLDNAAKYTERGGRIVLSLEQQGAEAVLTVRDFGIGLAADMVPRVFEIFAQADAFAEKSQGGLGLGLTLVKRLVELHGGRVEARSEGLGKGSEFVVRLPLSAAATLTTPRKLRHRETRAKPTPVPTARVLIVDDNRDAADSLAIMLRLSGHEVCTAYDGPAAVELAGEFLPDVAVLDIGLPKMDGFDVARAIRSQPWGRNMVLVALTGWGQPEDLRRSRDAGFEHHLVKPVDPDALISLVASCAPAPQLAVNARPSNPPA